MYTTTDMNIHKENINQNIILSCHSKYHPWCSLLFPAWSSHTLGQHAAVYVVNWLVLCSELAVLLQNASFCLGDSREAGGGILWRGKILLNCHSYLFPLLASSLILRSGGREGGRYTVTVTCTCVTHIYNTHPCIYAVKSRSLAKSLMPSLNVMQISALITLYESYLKSWICLLSASDLRAQTSTVS